MRSKVLLVFVFFVMPFFTSGQITPPGGVDPGEGGPKAPITETIALLVAGGIGLGAKYISKKKK